MKYYKYKIENLLVISKIITIHYFEFDRNFRSKGEAHDFWELVYADKGGVCCTADGAETVLREGEVLFHRPDEFHTLSANGRQAPSVFIISFETKSEAMPFFCGKHFSLSDRQRRLIYSILEESRRVFDLPYSDPELKKMPMRATPPLGGLQVIKNYLEILLISLLQSQTEQSGTGDMFLRDTGETGFVTEQVIDLLRKNIDRRLRVDDIAAQLKYNRSYLFKCFKRDTGMSIIRYWTGLRIDESKRLLRDEKLSVNDIAEKLGFESASYFSKSFKRVTGFSPLQYRKIHRR